MGWAIAVLFLLPLTSSLLATNSSSTTTTSTTPPKVTKKLTEKPTTPSPESTTDPLVDVDGEDGDDVDSEIEADDTLSQLDFIPHLPPSEWGRTREGRMREYMEIDWARAVLEGKCAKGTHIHQIYFWPGDRIQLKCRLCERGLVANGRRKTWGYAPNVTDFLENIQGNLVDGRYWLNMTDEYFNDPIGDGIHLGVGSKREKRHYRHPWSIDFHNYNPPRRMDQYIQRDGKLTIVNTSPSSSGLYFCVDETGLLQTRYFYLLNANVPINGITNQNSRHTEMHADMGWRCRTSQSSFHTIYPDSQWKFNFVPVPVIRKPEFCSGEEQCKDISFIDDLTLSEDPEPVTLNYMKKEDVETNVEMVLEWEKWSSCEEGQTMQTREGHCVLLRKPGTVIPSSFSDFNDARFLTNLTSIFDKLPPGESTIRLFSSVVLNLMMQTVRINGECSTSEYLSSAFRNIIFPSIGVEDFRVEDTKNVTYLGPWRTCFKIEHFDKNHENILGTYAIENRPCP